jgi:hypothetical protein
MGGGVAFKKPEVPREMVGEQVEFSMEMIERICDRVAHGEYVKDICREEGMPHRISFYRWCRDHEEAGDAYRFARLMSVEYYVETALERSQQQSDDDTKEKILRDKLMVETVKWFANKIAPHIYGEKQQVDVSGSILVEAVRYDAPTARIESSRVIAPPEIMFAPPDDDEESEEEDYGEAD